MQLLDVRPDELPNVPASHGPEQLDDVSATLSPYRPMGHAEHAAAPAREYWPAAHGTAVALVDPAGHA